MWQKRFNANAKPTAGADAAALVAGSSPINLSTMLEAISSLQIHPPLACPTCSVKTGQMATNEGFPFLLAFSNNACNSNCNVLPRSGGLLPQIRAKLFDIAAGRNWISTITSKWAHFSCASNKHFCASYTAHKPTLKKTKHISHSNLHCKSQAQINTATTKPIASVDAAPLCWKQYHPCKAIRRLRVHLVVSRTRQCPPTKASQFC